MCSSYEQRSHPTGSSAELLGRSVSQSAWPEFIQPDVKTLCTKSLIKPFHQPNLLNRDSCETGQIDIRSVSLDTIAIVFWPPSRDILCITYRYIPCASFLFFFHYSFFFFYSIYNPGFSFKILPELKKYRNFWMNELLKNNK